MQAEALEARMVNGESVSVAELCTLASTTVHHSFAPRPLRVGPRSSNFAANAVCEDDAEHRHQIGGGAFGPEASVVDDPLLIAGSREGIALVPLDQLYDLRLPVCYRRISGLAFGMPSVGSFARLQ
jgi:hypothetical protein